jgi:ATP-dependent RNA helicase DeaD
MNFEELTVSEEIRKAVKKMKYESTTEVQTKTIPLILEGHNVVVKSHTGSGKTAAFGIPVSEKIFTGKMAGALVVCPTRELAVQVRNELRQINAGTRLKISAFYGGHGMHSEFREIQKGIDILCATPGRLLDHFRSNSLDPEPFETVILDEADRMLDMGFIHDVREILEYVKPVNTHLFSATLDGTVAKLIQVYIPSYREIIVPEEIIGKNILEQHMKVRREERISALVKIISEAKNEKVLIFVSTKRSADYVARKIQDRGFDVAVIHGDKPQRAREYALQDFKMGKINVLVATDVAARGIQISNVEFVVNYDPASDIDMHTHRIGRTGRMGAVGHAITFVGEDGKIISTKNYSQKSRYGSKKSRQNAFRRPSRGVSRVRNNYKGKRHFSRARK